ncbi:hypothetical protein [Bradyrhizobium sp.]|uniref:hypothetical protein n=1 Tax=Bradyrhizobium sp. TaxID=376 RepID=UPI00271AFED9|nr:hypothetical protein [Bradyrhizobium sp.]MDO9297917.1 hypothetical protein [Bradyrhizobium sp.]
MGGLPAFDNDPGFSWNIWAGLLRPDDRLRLRVDAAIEALLAGGTIAQNTPATASNCGLAVRGSTPATFQPSMRRAVKQRPVKSGD